jgi:dolichyl-phosphate-mannose--protein O-mannosyl transferase
MTSDAGSLPPRHPTLEERVNEVKPQHVLLVALILFASFTHFWRLGTPTRCYFDEVYFPTTAAEILRGDERAWEFIYHENTHPPLSKILMAAGMGVFGHKNYTIDESTAPQGKLQGTNDCWGGDPEDQEKKYNPDWLYDPFGWRFPGALAGVGAVIFIYLLAKRLFQSEVAGLAAGFLLSVEGLAFTQSRIATPDAYVLCFMLASVYFLVTRRWLLSGVFLGATAASKWIGAFTIAPIIMYFAYWSFMRWRSTDADPRLKEAERVLLVGAGAALIGAVIFAIVAVVDNGLSWTVMNVGGVPIALGLFVIFGGLVAIATDGTLRSIPRAKAYIQIAASFPLFFLAVPFAVYMGSYVPMFLQGYDLSYWWDLNNSAYLFHRDLPTPHPYQSDFLGWPINMRPVFLYLGQGYAKIYNLGNPIVFWMALPALAFTLWQALKNVRLRIGGRGRLAIWGRMNHEQTMALYVVLSYLAFWLSLSRQSRALFSYHYLPALAFAILALSYVVHWLWQRPNQPWSRFVASSFLCVCGVTFLYFYPHWAAVDVPKWLDDTYYWFDSWR